MIESWVSVEAQGSMCTNQTCLCPGLFNNKCDPYQKVLLPGGAPNPNCTSQEAACCATVGGQGGLWNAMQQPLLNTTIKGLLYYRKFRGFFIFDCGRAFSLTTDAATLPQRARTMLPTTWATCATARAMPA